MILGITPARGGSKGITKKNIKPIAGKPLIAWTTEAAKGSKLIHRYVVSTEDLQIAAVARQFGAEVLERPAALATDDATTLHVLTHAMSHIQEADIVVLLQATCPIRSATLIDECIQRFIDTKADSLATGFTCKYLPYGSHELNRQQIEGFFYDDGNIYIMRGDLLKKGDRYGKKIEHVFTKREENIDIDDEFDFWMAEQILMRRKSSSKLFSI